MGERVHFWSDIPDDFRMSSRRDAETHADAEHGTTTHVDSVAKLKSVFRSMLKFNATLDQLDFHTHGGPGAIALGADSLDYTNVGIQLANQGFEKLFNKGAAIIFTGCNVAESYPGEYFLVCVGATLLGASGGKVMGSTGAGLADPLFTGDVFHPTGTWVSANVTVGGGVTLTNQEYLISGTIRTRMTTVRRRIDRLQTQSRVQAQIPAANAALSKAKEMVPDSVLSPAFANMFNACYYLEQAENTLDFAQVVLDSTNPMKYKL
jgi:hypothetical protein